MRTHQPLEIGVCVAYLCVLSYWGLKIPSEVSDPSVFQLFSGKLVMYLSAQLLGMLQAAFENRAPRMDRWKSGRNVFRRVLTQYSVVSSMINFNESGCRRMGKKKTCT